MNTTLWSHRDLLNDPTILLRNRNFVPVDFENDLGNNFMSKVDSGNLSTIHV